MKSLEQLFHIQKRFNDIFYDTSLLTESEKEEITRSLSLALHTEVSSLVSGVNFKDHRHEKIPVDLDRVLYESVDVFRYLLSILNLWGIESSDFERAFMDKDLFLNTRYACNKNAWSGQPVLIVDLDDVVAEFRSGFMDWLEDFYGMSVDRESSEYYTTACVKKVGLNPEDVFQNFISKRMLLNIKVNHEMVEVLNYFKENGYWIQFLTARPMDNLLCHYDTYGWISAQNIPYDRINFSGEKYRWVTQSEYYDSGKIVCAFDDSAKHASEYAKHGIKVFVPKMPYNAEVEGMKNITMYENPREIIKCFNVQNNR